MALRAVHITAALMVLAGGAQAQPAIDAFTACCFEAGRTAAQAKIKTPTEFGTSIPLADPFALAFSNVYYARAYTNDPALLRNREGVVQVGSHALYPNRDGSEKLGTTRKGVKPRTPRSFLGNAAFSRHFAIMRIDLRPAGLGVSQ